MNAYEYCSSWKVGTKIVNDALAHFLQSLGDHTIEYSSQDFPSGAEYCRVSKDGNVVLGVVRIDADSSMVVVINRDFLRPKDEAEVEDLADHLKPGPPEEKYISPKVLEVAELYALYERVHAELRRVVKEYNAKRRGIETTYLEATATSLFAGHDGNLISALGDLARRVKREGLADIKRLVYLWRGVKQ